MQTTRSDTPERDLTNQVDRDRGSGELGRYRLACREVDRLLDQGRLSEALRRNDEARALFRSLFASGQLG